MAKRHYWRAMCSTYLDDPNVGMLTDAQFRSFVLLQALATRNDDANSPQGLLPPVRHIAYALRSSEGEVAAVLGALTIAGLLEYDEFREAWRIVGWVEEQPTAGAERKARYDQRQREGDNTTATPLRYTGVTGSNTDKKRKEKNRIESGDEPPAAGRGGSYD